MSLEDISHHLHQTNPQLAQLELSANESRCRACCRARETCVSPQRCKKHLRLPRHNGPLSHTIAAVHPVAFASLLSMGKCVRYMGVRHSENRRSTQLYLEIL